MKNRTKLFAVLMALSLVAAACNQETDTTEAPTTDAPAATSAPAATDAPTETAAPATTEAMAMVETDGVTVTDDTIYVGMLADLSGPFAALVKDIVDGEIAVFNEYNERTGGIGGQYKIEVLVEDTSYDPAIHLEKYDALKDKVVAFTQSTGSPHTASIAQKLVEDDLFAIPLSWYSGWADPELGANVLEQGPNYCIEAMSVVEYHSTKFAEENGRAATWAVASLPGEYGQDGAAGAKYAIDNLDSAELVYDAEAIIGREGNPEASQGIVDNNPDFVFVTVTPGGLGALFGAAALQGDDAIWTGSGPSYNFALLGSAVGPALSERYFHSGYYAPYGTAGVEGMSAVEDILKAHMPDAATRQITDSFTRGYIEATIMINVLEDAYAAGSLLPVGVLSAAHNLDPIDFGGLIPGGVQSWSGEPNDYLLRAIQIYDVNIDSYTPDGTIETGGNAGFDLVEDNYLGTLAAAYDYQGPCFSG